MNYVKSVLRQFSIPSLLQLILNISLIVLAVILCVLLVKELIHFGKMMLSADSTLNEFLEAIIAFFSTSNLSP